MSLLHGNNNPLIESNFTIYEISLIIEALKEYRIALSKHSKDYEFKLKNLIHIIECLECTDD